jgi:hypothetical protein
MNEHFKNRKFWLGMTFYHWCCGNFSQSETTDEMDLHRNSEGLLVMIFSWTISSIDWFQLCHCNGISIAFQWKMSARLHFNFSQFFLYRPHSKDCIHHFASLTHSHILIDSPLDSPRLEGSLKNFAVRDISSFIHSVFRDLSHRSMMIVDWGLLGFQIISRTDFSFMDLYFE